ncbi:hypothetical protein HELRODRAFT_189692 [Helobdella robusta]|uniref:Ig-like domain-containing protein n=1 Tax=Helobdella robusta TaxID=6412 RepID=T1FR94_HELRO|nr:hypothetical protein HELRODRAFT_189692 [Helobdella robusta]ESN91330.1 hypothetical protein HELRODRAFT_189692 [Helobdella robusta]
MDKTCRNKDINGDNCCSNEDSHSTFNICDQMTLSLMTPSRQTLLYNTPAVFICKAHVLPLYLNGSGEGELTVPPHITVNVQWFLNNNEHLVNNKEGTIKIWQREEKLNLKMSVLRLAGAYVRRAGNVECRASVDQWIKYAGSAWTRSKGVITTRSLTKLTVLRNITEVRGFPKLHMEPVAGDLLALSGRHVLLKCEGYARPSPSVLWLKNGMEPIDNLTDSRYVLFNPGLLRIENLRREDAGLFECRANNTFGTNVGQINLIVTEEPCDLIHCKFGAKCVFQRGEAICDCMHKCLHEKQNLLCSEEGVTYQNYCEVQFEQCQKQKLITIIHRGKCDLRTRKHGSGSSYISFFMPNT